MATTTRVPRRYVVEFFDGSQEERDALPPLIDPFWSMVVRITETVVAPSDAPITIGLYNSATN